MRWLLAECRAHRRLPRRVLALTGGQNLAHDHFINFRRRHPGALQHFLNGNRAERMGGQ